MEERKANLAMDGYAQADEDRDLWNGKSQTQGVRETWERKPRSLFKILMCSEYEYFENTSGLDVDALCLAYAKCEHPFVEMRKYGRPLGVEEYAWIEQSEDLVFSVFFNAECDQISIFDGKQSKWKGLCETVYPKNTLSYYVIEDISTWADRSIPRSKLERFGSLPEAMAKFMEYRAKDMTDKPDMPRTTLGVCIDGIEFDVIHVRNQENCLSLDFTHSITVSENRYFMDDLRTLYNTVGLDKVRLHRTMSLEEQKDFVRRRYEYRLRNSGVEDVSVYMDKFDLLYERGEMSYLMPTENQKQIVEDIPFAAWENPYINTDPK